MKKEKTDIVRGIARDAKGGAVVITSSGSPVYIEHLDGWPGDVLGCEIEAKGKLVAKKYIPDPFIDEDGAISQGAAGDQDVLEDARWKKMQG